MEEEILDYGHDRRSFLRRAGLGGGVLALGPLAASLAAEVAKQSPRRQAAHSDFRHPAQPHSAPTACTGICWSATSICPMIVAGMGVADMDFRCAPIITAALQKRVAFPNWGYNIIDGDLLRGQRRGHPSSRASSPGTRSVTASTSIPCCWGFPARCSHSRYRQRAAGVRAQRAQGADGDAQLCRLLCRHRLHQDGAGRKPDEDGQWPLRNRLGRFRAPHDSRR